VLDSLKLRGDETVLDVGCGRGLLLIGAAKRLTTGKAVGVDIWNAEDLSGNRPEATLENARLERVAERVEVKDGDARRLPFADGTFDVAGFEHTCRLWTLVLEVSVMMAQFPSRAIAERSFIYRTLGLGYANIGGLLMTSGIPYDSAQGRAIAGAITAVMTGVAYRTSAEIAKELGAFADYPRNADAMLRVIRNHRNAAHGNAAGYNALSINPVPLDHASIGDAALSQRARETWALR
jgi:ribonucleotide reductase alpha subunit